MIFSGWILIVVMLSANKPGYEIVSRGWYPSEEQCAYFKDDVLQAKSTVTAQCVEIDGDGLQR